MVVVNKMITLTTCIAMSDMRQQSIARYSRISLKARSVIGKSPLGEAMDDFCGNWKKITTCKVLMSLWHLLEPYGALGQL